MKTATTNGKEEGHAAPHTQYAEIWRDLAAPFHESEVKELAKGGKRMKYITARSVMNRLDFTVGVENWWDRYTPGEHSVMCELFIRLPDGQVISKVDAGAYAGMADKGDDDKSGFSDALKRAAAKFGVGRYLYGDGTLDYRPPPIDNQSGFAKGQYASTDQADAFLRAMGAFIDKRNSRWLDGWTDEFGEIQQGIKPELLNLWQADNHLVKWGKSTGRLNPEVDADQKNRQMGRYTAIIYHASKAEQAAIAKELERYCDEQERLATEKLRRERPELFGADEGADDEPENVNQDEPGKEQS